MSQALVGIILGSQSDLEVMQATAAQLEEFGVPFELVIASAHRNPARVHAWAAGAASRGMKVIIAAAGKAAHLAGVVAAFTPLPVIAVPMKTSDLGGLDSLLSMVQMPTGVPVATVAINGARNAAILATQILGTVDERYRQQIEAYKLRLTGEEATNPPLMSDEPDGKEPLNARIAKP
jgi:5-(carboxyamino)imidazole ribonucleotide mutase